MVFFGCLGKNSRKGKHNKTLNIVGTSIISKRFAPLIQHFFALTNSISEMSIAQWRQFNFFDKQQVIDPTDKSKSPAAFQVYVNCISSFYLSSQTIKEITL